MGVSNPLLDKLLPCVRPALAPVYYSGRGVRAAGYLMRMLSNEYLKGRLGRCGRNVRLNGRMRFYGHRGIELGNNVHINDNAFLRGEGGIRIGDNCHISRNLVIYSINHRYEGDSLPYDEEMVAKPVRIEENVWIGMNVTIAPGITVGEGAIVGMGVVLRDDVEPLEIVSSGSHRVLRSRDKDHYRRLCEEGRFSGPSGLPR